MQTVADLLGVVENELDRPVVDRTGLAEAYDFNLFFAPERARAVSTDPATAGVLDAASDAAPTLFAAFERQLGLKLEPEKRPFSVLVVDKVNRTPTEN
jgi:uncharacterized protein (TIGR03435 family)